MICRPCYSHFQGVSGLCGPTIRLWCTQITPFLPHQSASVRLFCCSKIGGPIVGIYKSLTETWMWKLGTSPRSFISGEKYVNWILFAVWIYRVLIVWKVPSKEKMEGWLTTPRKPLSPDLKCKFDFVYLTLISFGKIPSFPIIQYAFDSTVDTLINSCTRQCDNKGQRRS
jgi:hypothetical protein